MLVPNVNHWRHDAITHHDIATGDMVAPRQQTSASARKLGSNDRSVKVYGRRFSSECKVTGIYDMEYPRPGLSREQVLVVTLLCWLLRDITRAAVSLNRSRWKSEDGL